MMYVSGDGICGEHVRMQLSFDLPQHPAGSPPPPGTPFIKGGGAGSFSSKQDDPRTPAPPATRDAAIDYVEFIQSTLLWYDEDLCFMGVLCAFFHHPMATRGGVRWAHVALQEMQPCCACPVHRKNKIRSIVYFVGGLLAIISVWRILSSSTTLITGESKKMSVYSCRRVAKPCRR